MTGEANVMGRISLAAIAAGLLLEMPLQAGLYDPQRPTSPLVSAAEHRPDGKIEPLRYDQFRDELDRLTSIADPLKPNGPRAAALKTRDELLSRGIRSLSSNELAQLGALQWQIRDGEAAQTALKQAAILDPRSFWALTNLGSVHQALGQLREALPNLESARDVFPDPWPIAPAIAGPWFRQVEGYQFKLLRLRLRESMGRPVGGRPVPAADVDALFEVRFAGPGRHYEAGKLADSEWSNLPSDAISIVQQLLLWFPEDTRLLWLLGELYNATGNLEAASKILDLCVWSRRFESPALREHRRVVQEAYDAQAKAAEQSPSPTAAPTLSVLPGTWQVYTVAITFGFLILVLAYWQVSELLRRTRRPIE
jgi:tetratricopeptide (TPR) repeat protein